MRAGEGDWEEVVGWRGEACVGMRGWDGGLCLSGIGAWMDGEGGGRRGRVNGGVCGRGDHFEHGGEEGGQCGSDSWVDHGGVLSEKWRLRKSKNT